MDKTQHSRTDLSDGGWGAPVVVTFIAAVGVGFAVGMILTSLDNRYHLTERCRARMMGWEQDMEKELAEAKTKIVTASKQTYQASKTYVKAEVIKIDKYYQSAASMIGDFYAQSSWAFMT